MQITCPKCQTKFKLEDSLIPPEGGWVRCSRCQDIFMVEKPAPELDVYPPPLDTPRPDDPGLSAGMNNGPMADFGLFEDDTAPAKPRRKGFRLIFLLFVILIILPAIALGAIIALDRLHLKPELIAPLRDLPVLNMILSKSSAPVGSLSLNNVRSYYRENQHVGRICVIQGEVLNLSEQAQVNVLVQGRVYDIHNNPARQAVIYAGPVFTPDQLRELSLTDIQAHLSQPQDASGNLYELPARGTLPFMIVLANLPDNISDYTADVVGWEAAPAR